MEERDYHVPVMFGKLWKLIRQGCLSMQQRVDCSLQELGLSETNRQENGTISCV